MALTGGLAAAEDANGRYYLEEVRFRVITSLRGGDLIEEGTREPSGSVTVENHWVEGGIDPHDINLDGQVTFSFPQYLPFTRVGTEGIFNVIEWAGEPSFSLRSSASFVNNLDTEDHVGASVFETYDCPFCLTRSLDVDAGTTGAGGASRSADWSGFPPNLKQDTVLEIRSRTVSLWGGFTGRRLVEIQGIYKVESDPEPLPEISAEEDVQVRELMRIGVVSDFIFDRNKASNHVVISRETEEDGRIEARAEVIEASERTLQVRVPVALLGDRQGRLIPPPPRELVPIQVTVTTPQPDDRPDTVSTTTTLRLPWHLIYDEVVFLPRGPRQQILPQFTLEEDGDVETFLFVGRTTDGPVALRVLNPSILGVREEGTSHVLPPLILDDEVEVYRPSEDDEPTGTGKLLQIGLRNAGPTFGVSQDGLYLICVAAHEESEFPAPFQIHLAGDVGLPRRLVNGKPEHPRGIRLDTLFNHPAPRPQQLASPGNLDDVGALGPETALFKFGNAVESSPFAVAVLIPPITIGTPITRAEDPLLPIGITTPTARTPACGAPASGSVIDFTQVPIPGSVVSTPDVVGGPCAVLGQDDGITAALPLATTQGANSGLILDMGSGQEIIDQPGPDLRVYAVGAYTVAVGNTPFQETLVPLGAGSGTQDFDLGVTAGVVTLARYVLVESNEGAQLDAVQGLHMAADDFIPNVGPAADAGYATITMRRAKTANNFLDPFLELIGPDGRRVHENESGFGDPTSLNLSDAALIDRELRATGFYRFLGRGYHQAPSFDPVGEHEFTGAFFVRLETGGGFNTEPITISPKGEAQIDAQRTGAIARTRERDSYLLVANPGQPLKITVTGSGQTPLPDPRVELHDPEGFLIAANDDYATRGKNAVIELSALPALTGDGSVVPSPSAYRIIVSGTDQVGGEDQAFPLFPDSRAWQRQVNGGTYDLKVFSGELSTVQPEVVYETDFSDFLPGSDTLHGHDGWTSNVQGQGTSGIVEDRAPGLGRSAFLGYNPPSVPVVGAIRRFNSDPIGSGLPIVTLSVDLAVMDSDNDEFDDFLVLLFSPSDQLLAGLRFDNLDLEIARTEGDDPLTPSFLNTGADFYADTLYTLTCVIDFAANTWSATLSEVAEASPEDMVLFTDALFHDGDQSLELGGVSFLWQVRNPSAPGDNWLLLDNLAVSLGPPRPAPPIQRPRIDNITAGPGDSVRLSWLGVPGHRYQVEHSGNLLVWGQDLPDSLISAGPTPGTLIFTDPAPVGPRFYRLLVFPTPTR